ncbi:MAG: GWxTD domain-containing protein [Acidobacteria bacterium]|nr:MAG: GWxTD domain-containing protein [Acidobacteriota bacterium]
MLNKQFLSSVLLLAFSAGSFAVARQQQEPGKNEALRQEESKDYYKQWLKQDVVYILTEDEKSVFEKLTTNDERESFIEQFWQRRDPDPRTPSNEFKEEHYRRIAYANDHFTSGDRGWMTDRGRIYIIHGPPDSIESRPSGGFYRREMSEGGGVTSTYPFERWRYRHIDGLGDDIVLEFVDNTFTDKYQLAVFPWEKDALMQFPGAGKTLAEETRLADRADRPGLNPGAGGHGGANPNLWYRRANDMPFARYEAYAKVQAPPVLRYPDLKQIVKVNIGYSNLTFEAGESYFRLNEDQVLVPITIRIANKQLTFKPNGDYQTARIGLYGIVTSMTQRIAFEFEDTMVTSFRNDQIQIGVQRTSIYQRVIPLDRRNRYRIDLVLKDVNSEKVGVVQKALIPPTFDGDKLAGSSLIISDYVQPLGAIPEGESMFVLGDVKVRPNIHKIFSPRMPLGLYLQVYNAALDQSTQQPALRVTYKLLRDGKLLQMAVDEKGEPVQYYSSRRVVLVKHLSLEGLDPGKYEIQLEVADLARDQTIQAAEEFTIVEETKLALK